MGDIRLTMAMRSVAALCCLLVAYGVAENPVESLDAGEIAEIDDGNFVDVFDSDDVGSVNVQHDVDHMGSQDVSSALETWDALYGEDHPSKLVASNEPDSENPKIAAKKQQEQEITQNLLKSNSVEETTALEVKLGKVKDDIKELETADESPDQAKANLEKDIQKEVARARTAKSEARKTLLAAKDSATTEKAQSQMKAAQKIIDQESEKLAKAQADGDENQAKRSSDIIKAKNQGIVKASAATLISHEHQALVQNAARTMSKYLDKPKIFAKVNGDEPTLVEMKPEVAGASQAQAQEVKAEAKVQEAVAEKQLAAAEDKAANAT